MTYLEELQSIISDMYKDANGIRPRGDHYWSQLGTVDACRAELDRLEAEIVSQVREDRARQERQTAAFEARVQELIAIGAGDRATATRWLMDSTHSSSNDELEWAMDLPMGYLKREAA